MDDNFKGWQSSKHNYVNGLSDLHWVKEFGEEGYKVQFSKLLELLKYDYNENLRIWLYCRISWLDA